MFLESTAIFDTGYLTFVLGFTTVKSVALRAFVSPATSTVSSLSFDCVTLLRINFFTSTSLVVSAESLPTVILAVIVALPALTPVTVPSAATVAIELSLDV